MKTLAQHQILQRKQDHIKAVLEDVEVERAQTGFEQIRLTHRALPELDFNQVDSNADFLGKQLSFPFLISSMTGGADQTIHKINRNLASAAERCNVALAVGSQRIMFKDAEARKSFQLRQYAPNIPIIANIGAVQLNYELGLEHILQAIDILEADALYLHLNPLQEIIQPEGDRNFAQLADKIQQLVHKLPIPIILKEVGSGLSSQDMELAVAAGVTWIDVAGRGGTSWSRIEAHRSDNELGVLFQDWGLTTVESLLQTQPYQDKINVIASGGIRNGIDMAKSVILGAQICGTAAPLLEPAMTSADAVVHKIDQFHQEFRSAQFLLGMADLATMRNNFDLILSPPSWPATNRR